jgi:hypothetical protein
MFFLWSKVLINYDEYLKLTKDNERIKLDVKLNNSDYLNNFMYSWITLKFWYAQSYNILKN